MGESASAFGFNPALLHELHLLTREGQLNQDARRKLKQIQHLLQFITPLLDAQVATGTVPVVVDHGAGKSYLGFLLVDQWFNKQTNAQTGQVIGIEMREDLVQRSKELADKFGFHAMRFIHSSVAQAQQAITGRVDVVTALHACNTATDDAIDFGLVHQAKHMVLVPCCQAEVASSLRASKAQALKRTPLSELWRHPHHTREFGAQITNVLRCLRLEASGYQVSVTELVGWEHSMKNELIIATKNTDVARKKASERLSEILQATGLEVLSARFAPSTH
jgi:Methyltransferase domain